MPWTAEDAKKHKEGLSKKLREKWAEIANRVLQQCKTTENKSEEDCEAKAIKVANSEVESE